MNRDKIFELMLQAGCSKYCNPKNPELEGFIVNDFVLERIVALIELEVRGDAEPVGEVIDRENACLFGKRELAYGTLLYTHPAPSVVRQLVEAAKRAMNYAENVVMAEGVYFDHDDDLPFIESALAAAKETGI